MEASDFPKVKSFSDEELIELNKIKVHRPSEIVMFGDERISYARFLATITVLQTRSRADRKRIEEQRKFVDLQQDRIEKLEALEFDQTAVIERLRGALGDNSPVVEELAAYAHTAWSGWMRYLFKISTRNEDGSVTIPVGLVKRWLFQVDTEYRELPDTMKPSDRKEAGYMLAIIRQALDAGKE